MLAAGAALQAQLLALSTCLHKQTLVTVDTECHKGMLLLADKRQPAVGGGGVGGPKGEGVGCRRMEGRWHRGTLVPAKVTSITQPEMALKTR